MSETDVLVVGAGPTGLMLAHELACRGVRVRIIDKNESRAGESRALVVHARSLELCDRHGLADIMVDRGRKALAIEAHFDHTSFTAQLGDIGVDDTRFPFVLFLSQAETEQVLLEALEKRGVPVERRSTLASFSHDAHGVRATIERNASATNGEREEVRAKYLVGCDGAHSAVRKGLGLEFRGAPYAQEFFLADAIVESELAADRAHFFLTKGGLFVVFPFKDGKLVRLLGQRRGAPASDRPPTLEEMQQAADTLATVPIVVKEIRWSSNYRLHHRAVDEFRVGRVFLAGDAAHIHSPAGGQGMNTGIQDAANLAWKLADALDPAHWDAHAEVLLDSYQAERRPVARWLLRYTDRLFRLASVQNGALLWARNRIIPRVLPPILASRSRRQRGFRFVSQLAVAYEKSPIVSALGKFSRGPAPGERAPDGIVEHDGARVWLSEIIRAHDHVVLAFGEVTNADTGDGGTPVVRIVRGSRARSKSTGTEFGARTVLDSTGALFTRYGVRENGARGEAFVVRPDRYIAVRGTNDVRAAIARATGR